MEFGGGYRRVITRELRVAAWRWKRGYSGVVYRDGSYASPFVSSPATLTPAAVWCVMGGL